MSKNTKPEGFLGLLSAPARRALESIGVSTLEQLTAHTEAELFQLHGLGPASIPILQKAMADAGLAFQKE